MPAPSALPTPVQSVTSADVVVLSQTTTGGANPGSNVVVQAPVSSLLGLVPQMGAATTIPLLPAGTTPTTGDNVVIVQDGIPSLVPYSQTIDGQTLSSLATAGAASDSDTLPVSQGGTSLVSQTMAAVSTYIKGKIPSYGLPVKELSTASGVFTIDATYNGCLIVVSAANITLNASFQGTGFTAEVLTVGSGSVVFGTGWITSTGATTMAANKHASLMAATYSGSGGGTISFADLGAATLTVAAPGAPTVTAAGTVTASSIVVNWTAPSTGGTPASYSINWRTTSGPGAWQSSPLTAVYPATTITITSLSAGTQYDVEVSATNSGGTSSQAVATSYATTSSLAAPGVPASSYFTTVTSSSITFNWTAPASGGVPTGYVVQYRLTGTGTWTPATLGNVLTYTATGLGSSQSYDFEVQATNAGGSSSFTSVISDSTSAAPTYAPNVPTSLASGSISSTSITWTWTAPAVDGSHSAAATYSIETSNDNATWSSAITGITTTSYTATGLTASTNYYLRVLAVNAAGSSAYTSGVEGTTSSGSGSVPGAVGSLAAGTVTSYTVPLTWTAPTTGGAATGVTVQFRLNGSAIWQNATTSLSGSATSYTVTGLIAGQTYQFNVFATNGSGSGAGSTVTATPTASGLAFADWGSGGYPQNFVHGASQAFVVFLTSGTNIASLKYGYSLTPYDIPTTLNAGTSYSSTCYGTLSAVTPASAGTYYGWMLFYDASGDCIFAVVGAAGQAVSGASNLTTGAITVT